MVESSGDIGTRDDARRAPDAVPPLTVLVACRRKGDTISPFVREQVESIQRLGVTCELFVVGGRGIRGYARAALQLRRHVRARKPDLVHAHYGLTGLLMHAVPDVPTVITYHGSDLNKRSIRPMSRFAARRANHVILVAESLRVHMTRRSNVHVIPCGVDVEFFHPEPMDVSRRHLGLSAHLPIVLFASGFGVEVKDYPLARRSIDMLRDRFPELHVRELRGLTRAEVRTTLNAASVVLLTSKSEGSPQVIKEALACDRPIVAVDVGDVRRLLDGVPNARVVSRDAGSLAAALGAVLSSPNPGGGRARAQDYSLPGIARNIVELYYQLSSRHA